MKIRKLIVTDDFAAICKQLDREKWGTDNDMAAFEPESLRQFVSLQNNLYVVGYEGDVIVCSALAYELQHPDKTRKSLYIDEIDTHPDYRRHGYGSELISWLREYASTKGLQEVWLTTESEGNESANKFYRSLNPDEELSCNLYGYKAQ